jgi:hypothetical protein
VAYAYNASYSGVRDQEDHDLKPPQTNSFARPYLEKTHYKKGLAEWLKVKTLNSNPSTTKKKKSGVLKRTK